MQPKRLPFEEFKKIYSKVPRLCIDLIVKNKDGILLTKRAIPPYKGYWHTPGGTLLLYEKINDAIQRISLDEFGSLVKIGELLGTMEFPSDEITKHSVSVVYLVEPKSTEFKVNWQAKELKFFKKIPPKTIKEQKEFILTHNLTQK